MKSINCKVLASACSVFLISVLITSCDKINEKIERAESLYEKAFNLNDEIFDEYNEELDSRIQEACHGFSLVGAGPSNKQKLGIAFSSHCRSLIKEQKVLYKENDKEDEYESLYSTTMDNGWRDTLDAPVATKANSPTREVTKQNSKNKTTKKKMDLASLMDGDSGSKKQSKKRKKVSDRDSVDLGSLMDGGATGDSTVSDSASSKESCTYGNIKGTWYWENEIEYLTLNSDRSGTSVTHYNVNQYIKYPRVVVEFFNYTFGISTYTHKRVFVRSLERFRSYNDGVLSADSSSYGTIDFVCEMNNGNLYLIGDGARRGPYIKTKFSGTTEDLVYKQF